jgi:hypothetical protein
MSRHSTNGLSGPNAGALYDDLQPWAAELCEQAWQSSLTLGRRRGAARMDFVPGWKEAMRQAGRLDVFKPDDDEPEETSEIEQAAFRRGVLAAITSIQQHMAVMEDDSGVPFVGRNRAP